MSTIFVPQFTEFQKKKYDEWNRKKSLKDKKDSSPFEKVLMVLKRSDDHYHYYCDYEQSLVYADECLRIIDNEMKNIKDSVTDHYEDTDRSVFANIDSLKSQAIIRKAMCWKKLKRDYREVISLLEEAVKIDPNRIEIFNQIAVVYMKIHMWDDSIKYLQKVITVNTDIDINDEYLKLKYWSLCNMAISLARMNNLKESKTCLEDAIKLIPTSTVAYEYLINISYETGNVEEALQYQNKSTDLKKNKSYIDSHLISNDSDRLMMEKKIKNILERAKISFINGKYKDTQTIIKYALEIIEKLEEQKGLELHDTIEIQKINSKIYRLEALLYLKIKLNRDLAIDSMNKSLSFNHGNIKLHYEFSRILYVTGHLNECLKEIEYTMKTFDLNEFIDSHYYVIIDLFILYSRVLSDLSKNSMSLEVLEKAEALCEDSPLSLSLRKIDMYMAMDMIDKSSKEIDRLMNFSSPELDKVFNLEKKYSEISNRKWKGGEEEFEENDEEEHRSNCNIL